MKPNEPIEIVDRGRGRQLSTSRVTVQDLVPYFIDGSPYSEILHCIPTLSIEEIQVVERIALEADTFSVVIIESGAAAF